MTKLRLLTILIVCYLSAGAQIQQSSPFEQKLMMEYLGRTDNLLHSVSNLLIDSKLKIKYLNELNAQGTQIYVSVDNLLQKLKWFESSFNVKLKKQTIFINSHDLVLKDIKVVGVFYTETSDLYSHLLAFNNGLLLIPDVYVTSEEKPTDFRIITPKESVKYEGSVNSSGGITLGFNPQPHSLYAPFFTSTSPSVPPKSPERLSVPSGISFEITPSSTPSTMPSTTTYPPTYPTTIPSYPGGTIVSEPNAVNYPNTSFYPSVATSNISYAYNAAFALPLSEVLTNNSSIFSDEIINYPTSYKSITQEFDNKMSLHEVGTKIFMCLNKLDYNPKIYMKSNDIKDGFLIQAIVEPFKTNGERFEANKRSFNLIYSNISYNSSFWDRIIDLLYIEHIGNYRLFIFSIKKSEIIDYSNRIRLSAKDVNSILSRQLGQMPKESIKIKMKDGYICNVLIFEFQRHEANFTPVFIKNPNLKPEIHLEQSFIMNTLRDIIWKP